MNIVLEEEKDDIKLIDIFQAYFNCRRNKRNKLITLSFDIDYEERLIQMWEEIKKGVYRISPSSLFIVEKPVKREICASAYKDRIIHHLIVMKLESLLEKEFIYDSYSCRINKGTLFGIKRLNRNMRRASHNYQKETYVLKLDINSYFINMDKNILKDKLNIFINNKYFGMDREKLIYLCNLVIDNDVTKNYMLKSPLKKWKSLPKNKSLFYTKEGCGLPIGNYTSQVFSNFYLNEFDHYMKKRYKYYGRYVDDFYIISNDRNELKNSIKVIDEYLYNNLRLSIHPKKIYLSNIKIGIYYLGAYIKPYRIYVSRRIKNNFIISIKSDNSIETINSYTGLLKHFNTYRLICKYLEL